MTLRFWAEKHEIESQTVNSFGQNSVPCGVELLAAQTPADFSEKVECRKRKE